MPNFGQGMGGDQYVVVKIKNVEDLVRNQGGATGKMAFALAPQTITNKVYDQIRAKLLAGFRSEGVDADVQVTASPMAGPRPPAEFLRGAVAGAVLAGGGWLLWKHVLRGLFK